MLLQVQLLGQIIILGVNGNGLDLEFPFIINGANLVNHTATTDFKFKCGVVNGTNATEFSGAINGANLTTTGQ